MRVGLVGAGAMGSALGANWIVGGASVTTCVAGRSRRTVDLVAAAGIETVERLDDVVRADIVVSTVAPADAVSVAASIADAAARASARPLVLDLNAVSPTTVGRVADALGSLELVDGSISGGPPTADRSTRVYVSGSSASRVVEVASPWLDVMSLGSQLGSASALKMCTASVYKGTSALVLQAMVTAARYGVLDEFLADTARAWPDDVPGWPHQVALAASKAQRFVAEMREIAATQRSAGMAGELFTGMAAVWDRVAGTPLGARAPEEVDRDEPIDRVVAGLSAPSRPPAGVLLDFSGTLFHADSAEQALLAALGPSFVGQAARLVELGAINGAHRPADLPASLADAWDGRDLSAAAHRAAYGGSAVHAGLSPDEANALYDYTLTPDAWHPYADTLRTLQGLRRAGVPVAVVSNIGWDPRPIFERYAADVDAFVLSDECGVLKPDAEIFRIACDAIGVAPADCVMVGDTPAKDGGSTEVGIEFRCVSSDPTARPQNALRRAVGLD